MRQRSEIVERYVGGEATRYTAYLIEEDWLDRAMVRIIQKPTSLATLQCIVHFVSCGRQPADEIKGHAEKYLSERYRLTDFVWWRSQEEVRASTPLSTYFHCVARVRDSVSG